MVLGREQEGKGREPPEKSYWGMAARECDSCRTTRALLFCSTHAAFLCGPCDTYVHPSTTIDIDPHERVPMCEVCEQAPAAFTCRADAAALCVSCDADIHSANPLARRHDRAHVLPFLQYSPTRNANPDPHVAAVDFFLKLTDDCEAEETERASMGKINGDDRDEYNLSAVDPYLDLDDHQYGCSSMTGTKTPRFRHADGVVAAARDGSVRPQPPPVRHELDDFANLNQTAYFSYDPSLSHSVSSEVAKVPEGSTAMDMTPDSQHERYWATEKQTEVERVARATDREARLMRYREKRKKRKFQKTIRYASRKVYAETRPRVKGRFVKRTELGGYADGIYASSAAAVTALMADAGYGAVPSF